MTETSFRPIIVPAAPWVICAHALQQMSTRVGWHLAQGLLVSAYFVAVIFTQMSARFFGAAGLELFQQMTYLNLVFTTIAGITCFSVCVVSERESGTLDLLRLTGLGPIGFLVGRWLPLLFGCSMLLLLQFPCANLALSMGGLLPGQIWAVMVVLLVHLFLVACLALLISVISTTSQRAVMSSFLLFGAWFSGPDTVAYLMRWILPGAGTNLEFLLSRMRTMSAFGSADQLLAWRSTSPPLWSNVETYQVIAGLIALLASWLLFERSVASTPLGRTQARAIRPHRQWEMGAMAIVWKDFRGVAGGWVGLTARLFIYPTVTLFYGGAYFNGVTYQVNWWQTHELSLRMVGWDSVIVLAQLFQREIRDQTWTSLVLLPQSRWQICYSKLAGALLALSPGWVWVAISSIGLLRSRSFTNEIELLFYVSIVIVGCHVSVLVSVLFARVPWTIGVLLGVAVAHLELEMSRSFSRTLGTGLFADLIFLLASVALCLSLHGLIALRIRHLTD